MWKLTALPLMLAMLLLKSTAWVAPIADAPVLPSPTVNNVAPADRQPPVALPATGKDLWSIDPRLQSAEGKRARQAFEAGKLDECLSHLETLAKEHPGLPPGSLLLAEVYYSKHDLVNAQRMLEQAATSHREHPEVFLVCGQLELQFGRLTNAWLHFKRALSLRPPADWPAEQANTFKISCYQGLAQVAEQRGDWSDAAEAFDTLADLTPETPATMERWARALLLSGNSGGALEQLRLLKREDPTRRPAELAVAALYASAGETSLAEPWYRKAIELDPDDPQAYLEFAGTLAVAGRATDARKYADKAVEKGSTRSADIAMLRGLLAMGEKDFAAAETHFLEVLAQRPGDFHALRRLPIVLAEQEEVAKRKRALQLATIQAQKFPQSAEAQATLAWVQLRQGLPEEARRTLAKSPRGADPETLYLMANLLVELNEPQAAKPVIIALSAQLRRPGWFPQRAEAEEWLKTVALTLD